MHHLATAHIDDIIDATLTVAELAEAQERLGPALLTPGFDQEFEGANERLGSVLAWYLRTGRYSALNDALHWFSDPEQALARGLVCAALQVETTSAITQAGHLSEALLMPVVVGTATANAPIPPILATELSRTYRYHHPENRFSSVVVSSSLLHADEVREWGYPEIYELNCKPVGTDLSHLAFRRVPRPTSARGACVLRFLLLHRETSANYDGGPSGDAARPQPNAVSPLAQALGSTLAEAYGTLFVCTGPTNVYCARTLGTELFARAAAGTL